MALVHRVSLGTLQEVHCSSRTSRVNGVCLSVLYAAQLMLPLLTRIQSSFVRATAVDAVFVRRIVIVL